MLAALALPAGAAAQLRRGNEFQVNSYTAYTQSGPSASADGDGDFVVAWQSVLQDGSPIFTYGVFARRFSSTGVALAGEFQVNSYTADTQLYPSVASSASGDFVVAWQSNTQDGSSFGVFAQRFSSGGVALASEFQVNTYTLNDQVGPSVAAGADGDFVVVWRSQGQLGLPNQYDLIARRISQAGDPVASEFQVNVYGSTLTSPSSPSVTASDDGDFVVAWHVFGDGSNYGIFARSFSSAGAPLTGDFQVNRYTVGHQLAASVTAAAGGDFVVAWSSFTQDGSFYGVFGQRFGPLAPLDVDGNGSTQPLTDGLLLLRHLFGFTGTTLTAGALGDHCTRCDAAAIEPYLDGLGEVIDIDGDQITTALTDGLLALRFLFGFTGPTLVSGVVGDECSRRAEGMMVSLP